MIQKLFTLIFILSCATFSCLSMDYSGVRFYVKDETMAALTIKLFQATADGRLTDLEQLIKENNIDIKNVHGEMNNTLLHEAAIKGKDDIVKFLLSQGADVMARNRKYNTAVHYAAQTDSIAIMDLLLQANPEAINARGWKGTTLLHWAARQGKNTMAAHLLSKGAQVNAKTSDGETPLVAAIRETYPLVVTLLLNNGAETPLQNYQFKGPLNVATDMTLDTDADQVNVRVIVQLIRSHMLKDKVLQDKFLPANLMEGLNPETIKPESYEKYHELSCCKKIGLHNHIMRNFELKEACALCLKDPKSILVDTTPPHMVPEGF